MPPVRRLHKAIDEARLCHQRVRAQPALRQHQHHRAPPSQTYGCHYFAQLSSLIITEGEKLGLRVIRGTNVVLARRQSWTRCTVPQTAMVDGLIYSPLELGPDDAAEVEVNYPLVLIGERIFTDKVDHIATGMSRGAKRATSYLLQTGCKRVAVVGVHPGGEVGSAALRFRGYLEALEGGRRAVRPGARGAVDHNGTRNDSVAAIDALLDSGVRPDGVVALNDMLASGVMHSIRCDLRIPGDISVIGFDSSDDSRYLSPALTSIAPGLGGRGAAVGAR